MPNSLIYRQGLMFRINEQLLPKAANKMTVKNDLYAAIYKEFQGAVKNLKYKNLTNEQKIKEVCKFAENWLKERKYT